MAYNQTAKGLAALGRKGDDTLLHVSKDELAGLQSIIGHQLPVNPSTGLHEAFELKNLLATLGIGLAGALTGGAALAAAPAIGALGATAVGAGVGALGGGTISAAQGKGFSAGALGGAISGGIGGFGSAGDFNAAGVAQDSAAKAGLGTPVVAPTPSFADQATGFGRNFKTGLAHQASAMTTKGGINALLMPVGAGAGLGTAATDMILQSRANAELAKQEKAQAAANEQDQQTYFANLGYPIATSPDANSKDRATQRNYFLNLINSKQKGHAAGGPITVQMPMDGAQVTATIPPKYMSEIEQINIPAEMNNAAETIKNEPESQGYAPGGYINTQPINPDSFYPQSQIPSARPYAAATPQRHEVIHGFEDGGMLDGPGDGMSDDIPANIDGQEEVRLADGEFVVPPDLVRMLGFGDVDKGAKLLDNLLPIVRQAAHGKKTQIKQDGGKLALEKMMTRAVKTKAS